MYDISRPSLLAALRRAGIFAQPDDDKGGDDKGKGGDGSGGDDKGKGGDDKGKGGEGGDKATDDDDDEGAGGGGDKKPIPYDRFQEVNKARRTAERELGTVKAENTTLKQQVTQLQSGDQSAALKAAQTEVTELKGQIQKIDDEFEDMLEIALADLPKDKAAIVRDIPGGPRAQFAWLNKHRASLAGGKEEPKGPQGPKNDKKPDGDGKKKEPSATAKAYVDSSKPAKSGWGQVTGS